MSALNGLRVLIVEDEPIVAMCLEDILETLGCAIVGPAGRLSEGLILAESATIGAAILDINLGGERSTPIAAALQLRGVPFAFASGYGVAPEGFDAAPLIEKPYSDDDIASTLRLLLG